MCADKKWILASGSPRRRELMEKMGISCQVWPSDREENVTSSDPQHVVEELSRQKCEDIAEKVKEDAVVIGADTVVAFQGEILGKPKGYEDAKRMMEMLQGQIHQVFTGVTVIVKEKDTWRKVTFCDTTDVEFYPMSDEEIEGYLKTKEDGKNMPEWADKAGGYGIQTGFGTKFIRGIKGDYYNVMGLPAAKLYQELKNLKVIL